ncbi:MAG TPA: SHOCT domain-containing protein [Symbiobacteriaceae bacterium]|nr:SHOCT domain-containing protein [Symbiobacteriaceae bacterium]
MFMWPLLLLIGLGLWFAARRESAVSRSAWLWILAAGLLVMGFGGFGMGGPGGMMMMGARGGMMGMHGMMGGRGGMMGMHGMMGPQYGSWGWHGWVGMGLHALLIMGAIVVAYFAWKRTRSGAPLESEAMQVLRMRLAKGEITAEEFDLLRQKLQG